MYHAECGLAPFRAMMRESPQAEVLQRELRDRGRPLARNQTVNGRGCTVSQVRIDARTLNSVRGHESGIQNWI